MAGAARRCWTAYHNNPQFAEQLFCYVRAAKLDSATWSVIWLNSAVALALNAAPLEFMRMHRLTAAALTCQGPSVTNNGLVILGCRLAFGGALLRLAAGNSC